MCGNAGCWPLCCSDSLKLSNFADEDNYLESGEREREALKVIIILYPNLESFLDQAIDYFQPFFPISFICDSLISWCSFSYVVCEFNESSS